MTSSTYQDGFLSQLGDLTSGCASSLTHFNPFNAKHGAPGDAERHVGDLGNIQSDASGTATFSFTDKLISLNGPLSVVGRTLVVHAVSIGYSSYVPSKYVKRLSIASRVQMTSAGVEMRKVPKPEMLAHEQLVE